MTGAALLILPRYHRQAPTRRLRLAGVPVLMPDHTAGRPRRRQPHPRLILSSTGTAGRAGGPRRPWLSGHVGSMRPATLRRARFLRLFYQRHGRHEEPVVSLSVTPTADLRLNLWDGGIAAHDHYLSACESADRQQPGRVDRFASCPAGAGACSVVARPGLTTWRNRRHEATSTVAWLNAPDILSRRDCGVRRTCLTRPPLLTDPAVDRRIGTRSACRLRARKTSGCGAADLIIRHRRRSSNGRRVHDSRETGGTAAMLSLVTTRARRSARSGLHQTGHAIIDELREARRNVVRVGRAASRPQSMRRAARPGIHLAGFDAASRCWIVGDRDGPDEAPTA